MTYKLWTTNELLTSTDMNNLSKQTVIVCTSGTRPSSPPNGMFIYETDTTKLQKWNGSAWRPIAGSRTSYTPTLTSSATPPNLGTGSTAQGWYAYMPEGVIFVFFIKFGTSGISVGTGNYQVTVPVVGATFFGASNAAAYGVIQLGDASSGATQVGSCFVDAPSGGTVLGLAGTGTGSVGPAAPWAWAASDYIAGSITYSI